MANEPAKQQGLGAALALATSLFFAWGFVTATIDPLVPAVRSIFSLSLTEALLTQFAFFIAYGVVSLPAAFVVARLGSANAVLAALGTMIVGCLLMPVATSLAAYPVVLLALFVIASGITLLQVSANPLAAVLGTPERSHLRLTLAQAINSLGTVLAPAIGATVMLRGGVFADGPVTAQSRTDSLRAIDTSFFAIAVVIAVIALLFWWGRPTIVRHSPPATILESPLSAFASRWALAGAGAIFLYVGAEVSIGSILINFLGQPDVLGVSAERGGHLVSLYWLGAMAGRFAGGALLARVRAARLLVAAAAAAMVLCLVVTRSEGMFAAVMVLSIGVFNSVMFPTIFTLTLERSSASTASTSGLLCMAIVGGALLPPLTGLVADRAGLAMSFLIPLAAYAGVVAFALAASRNAPSRSDADGVPSVTH